MMPKPSLTQGSSDSSSARAWNERYRNAHSSEVRTLWTRTPSRDLIAAVSGLAPGTALDIATGDGRNAIWLAQQGWKTTAVDFSAEALAIAAEHQESANVSIAWMHADVASWSPTEQFNLITMTYLHLTSEDNREMIRRAGTWLAPGGTLVVIGHDVANLAAGGHGPKNPDVLYTPDLMRTAAASLEVLRAETVRRDPLHDPETPDDASVAAADTVLVARASNRGNIKPKQRAVVTNGGDGGN